MSDFILTNLPCSGRILIVADAVTEQAVCTSGSVVEYRLAKARVAGSNPVSCSQRDRKKSHPMDGSFFYVQALPGSNGSKYRLRSVHRRRHHVRSKLVCFFRKNKQLLIFVL